MRTQGPPILSHLSPPSSSPTPETPIPMGLIYPWVCVCACVCAHVCPCTSACVVVFSSCKWHGVVSRCFLSCFARCCFQFSAELPDRRPNPPAGEGGPLQLPAATHNADMSPLSESHVQLQQYCWSMSLRFLDSMKSCQLLPEGLRQDRLPPATDAQQFRFVHPHNACLIFTSEFAKSDWDKGCLVSTL